LNSPLFASSFFGSSFFSPLLSSRLSRISSFFPLQCSSILEVVFR
jgi:hypothetical protein